jgi:hypothetical protein
MVTHMNLWISSSPMLSDYFLNHLFSSLILFRRSFHKHISQITVFYFFLCHLNFGSTFHLELSNSFSSFANDQTHTIIRHWDNIGVRRWWTIRSHHAIIHGRTTLGIVIDLLSHHQLLFSDFVSSRIIGRNHSFNCILSSSHTVL